MCVLRSTPAKAGRLLRARASASAALGLNGAPGNGPKPARTTRMTLRAEEAGNLLDRRAGRHAARGDIGLDPRQRRLERAIGSQRLE